MPKYIKCNRDNGLVMGCRVYSRPYSMSNPSVFWVEVQEPSQNQNQGQNQKADWQHNSIDDHVQFQLYQPLYGSTGQPVVNELQGQWLHSISVSSAEELEQRRVERIRDQETHRLIKVWCERQTEGSEEAFINLGIENPVEPRYQAYREAASEIRQLRK